jgi:hypothetical protein
MQAGMNLSITWQIITQARKITLLRVTAGVRPYVEISGILSKICSHLHIWFLSKNVLLCKNSLKPALFIHVDRSLPVD